MIILYLLAPVMVVVLFSFNDSRSLQQFQGFSLRWYHDFLGDEALRNALFVSLKLGGITMIGSTVLGLLLAFGLSRLGGRLVSALDGLSLVPMITPDILFCVALLMGFTQLFLVSPSFLTLVIGHLTLTFTYTTIAIRARLLSLGPELEEAAMDLGASRPRAIFLVVLPNLLPAIAASALLALAISLDDFSISLFNSGQGSQPLPVKIWSQVRFGVSPTINAISTAILVFTVSVLLLALTIPRLLGRLRRRGDDGLSGWGDAF